MEDRFDKQDDINDNLSNYLKTYQETLRIIGESSWAIYIKKVYQTWISLTAWFYSLISNSNRNYAKYYSFLLVPIF